ncbi:MAG: dipeptide/oligopeptide/nickel ABC transporter ATP-binding protein [Lachnospiraceae bacterium]|nr:dipeptide/oligopeptide/nickel ABC transporter ATP-binding protein [Lachnospiraceae bacterium]
MSEIVLKAENLKKVFSAGKRALVAVDGVSFALERGQCLGIVGESGSGKSTIARMMTRLTDVTDGTIILNGKDITHVKGKELRDTYREIQMVFQMPMESFDPRRTLGDGIGESLRNRKVKKAERKARVRALLADCGLSEEFAARYPHQVSGGQCQRAAIARALAVNPSVLICDEATSALDVTVQKQIVELLIRLKQSGSLSFLLICHDLALVQRLCDTVLVLQHGKAVEYGETQQVLLHPQQEYTKRLIASVL